MNTKPNIISFTVCILITILLVKCDVLKPVKNAPQPRPVLSSDYKAFVELGCIENESDLDCSKLELEETFNCQRIYSPQDPLAELSPKLPIVICQTPFLGSDRFYSNPTGLVRNGCMRTYFENYIIYKDDKFELIDSLEKFNASFAPVESQKEALGYAVALSTSHAKYEFDIPPRFRTYTTTIEATNVKESDQGYIVRLFSSQICGCGPHSTYAVDYLVGRDGDFERGEMTRLYEDPILDALCVD